MLPICPWEQGHPLEVIDLQEAPVLKQTDSPYSMSSSARGGAYELLLPRHVDWFYLVLVQGLLQTTTAAPSHECTGPAMSEDIASGQSSGHVALTIFELLDSALKHGDHQVRSRDLATIPLALIKALHLERQPAKTFNSHQSPQPLIATNMLKACRKEGRRKPHHYSTPLLLWGRNALNKSWVVKRYLKSLENSGLSLPL